MWSTWHLLGIGSVLLDSLLIAYYIAVRKHWDMICQMIVNVHDVVIDTTGSFSNTVKYLVSVKIVNENGNLVAILVLLPTMMTIQHKNP